MTQSPLYIGFGQNQVAVQIECPSMRTKLQKWFNSMLYGEPSCVVREFRIEKVENKYIISILNENLRGEGDFNSMLATAKYEIIMSLIRARTDLLWIHAGAVANESGVILFPAVGGSGKSTLVSKLYQKGLRYLGDDVVGWDMEKNQILAFPQTPRIRENVGREIPKSQLSTLKKYEILIPQEDICHTPMPISKIIIPRYSFGSETNLSSCSPGKVAIELLTNCVNFVDHKQVAIKHICQILKEIPLFELTFSDADEAIEVVLDLIYSYQYSYQVCQ